MLTPQQFHERFVATLPDDLPPELFAELAEFVAFDPAQVATIGLAEADAAILAQVGMPRNAPPFLFFGGDQIDLLAKLDGAPDKIIIGANGFGDRVCLDVSTNGTVLEVSNENHSQHTVMNASIVSLAQCICAFAEFRKTGDGDAFRAEIAEIDPAAAAAGSWWMLEIDARSR